MTPFPFCRFYCVDESNHPKHQQIRISAGWVVNIRSLADQTDSEDPPTVPQEFYVTFTAPLKEDDGTNLGQCVMLKVRTASELAHGLTIKARDIYSLKVSLRTFLGRKGLTLGSELSRAPHEARSWWIVNI